MSTTHGLFDEEERQEFIAELKEWPNTDWGTDYARHSVSPFISFYFPPKPGNHVEATLLMLDVHEAFEQMLGKPYTIATHPVSERPYPYGSSRIPDLRKAAMEAYEAEAFLFCFTDEQNHRSSPTTAGYFWRHWFNPYKGKMQAYSSITFYYRWQWWLDNRDAWRCFVLKTIDLLKADQVYSGFAMANPLQFGTRSAIETWERSLTPAFYGLDIDYDFVMHSDLENGIRPPTWGFLLSDPWREKLDLTRKQVQENLTHPRISITELHSGLWIELGEQPELYPVELGVPELPMLLNKLLKPIRNDEMGLLGLGQWEGDPNERFTDPDSRRWLARFDADSDWPSTQKRFNAPPAKAAGQGLMPQLKRIIAGMACTQAGWWLAVGQTNTRRAFKAGETMPSVDSASAGQLTLWQLDADQTAPEPARHAHSQEPAPREGRWELETDSCISCIRLLNEKLPTHQGRTVLWRWTVTRMRACSGEPCPYPGAYIFERKEGIRVHMNYGVVMPTLEGERVSWLWDGMEPPPDEG
ncbi:DUF3396 domain-containing protein [Pseudomonas sp. FSL R10-1350]|uniref:type VI immunity family protein n=1 Tax=unclassified Pseudomonas TaxID=196821 RepID=UPI0013237104|nr:DUF3396 domain-containing protein [Pseudomonas sp. FSL R10-0399]MQU64105.1 DUF3396 domain-containing protein [Pseudomonas sp. FSL R10-1350]